MNKVVHVIRYELKTTSRVQAQIRLDKGSVLESAKFLDIKKLFLLAKTSRPGDVIIFHQHCMVLNILIFSIMFGSKFRCIFDIHDIHDRMGSFPWSWGAKKWIKHLICSFAECLVAKAKVEFMTVSKGLVDYYATKYQREIFLFFSTPRIECQSEKELVVEKFEEKRFRLVYFGVITEARFPLEKISALVGMGFYIDVFGELSGNNEYRKEFEALLKTGGVCYRGSYEGSGIVKELYRYFAMILLFDSTDYNIVHCMPNKLFQALEANLLCIVSENLSEIRKTFEASGAVNTLDAFLNGQFNPTKVMPRNVLMRFAEENAEKYLDFILRQYS
jgi:hypothetical protein